MTSIFNPASKMIITEIQPVNWDPSKLFWILIWEHMTFFFFWEHMTFIFIYLLGLFRAAPVACVDSQAKGWVRAAAAVLHHSSRQHQILNPRSEVRDRTCVLMDANQIRFCWATIGTPHFHTIVKSKKESKLKRCELGTICIKWLSTKLTCYGFCGYFTS